MSAPPRGLLFSGERVRVGKFRARPADELFRKSGPARACLVVFPRTAVRIRHAGRPSVVGDPTRVIFYNAGQEYARSVIDPAGDMCDWFAYREEDVIDAFARHDEGARARGANPFVLTHGPGDPRTYALQRFVFEQVTRGAPDPLLVEETAFRVLARVAANAHRAPLPRRAQTPSRARRVALADALRARLAVRFGERASLGELARELGVSPFHLCRVFREETGHTVHGYLNAARLHHALERVTSGCDLTALGLELGFASHSHFTYAFRRMFGAPPSQASKILTARGTKRVQAWPRCEASSSVAS
jgi:AraC-like DNA-binding protein